MSDGTEELTKLAHLLRLGATAARLIASVRTQDEKEIERLAARADQMAAELEALLEKPAFSSPTAPRNGLH